MILSTIEGTMTVEAWHIGRHIILNSSNFHWEIRGNYTNDLINFIKAFERRKSFSFYLYGHVDIRVAFRDNGAIEFQCRDLQWINVISRTVLSPLGGENLLKLLKLVTTLDPTIYLQGQGRPISSDVLEIYDDFRNAPINKERNNLL